MPRIARIIAAGYPHHISQRGNNRATVFFDDEDRQTYLKLLSGYAQKYHIAEVTGGSDLEIKTDTMPHWFKIALWDKFASETEGDL